VGVVFLKRCLSIGNVKCCLDDQGFIHYEDGWNGRSGVLCRSFMDLYKCSECALPQSLEFGECEFCKSVCGVPIDRSISACFYYPSESMKEPYNQITQYVLELKRDKRVADLVACAMALYLIYDVDIHRIRLIVPVPKHEEEVRSRGFNQAVELAQRLAGVLKREFNHEVPVAEDLVIKIDPRKRMDIRRECEKRYPNNPEQALECECRETEGLYTINEDALGVLNKLSDGDVVLIVDDVKTRGVTASTIVKLLRSVAPNRGIRYYLLTAVRDYYQRAMGGMLPPWLWEDYEKAKLKTDYSVEELALIHYAWVNWDKVKGSYLSGINTTMDIAKRVINGYKLVDVLSRVSINNQEVVEEVHRLLNYGIRVIPMDSPEYPTYLRVYGSRENNVYPPLLLYHIGQPLDWSVLRPVAVVGTRELSDSGVELTREIVRELVKSGYTIITGLAKGVDLTAAKEALNNGGRVIGVVPYMVNARSDYTLYLLSERGSIADKLLRNGAVVSENLYKGRVEVQLASRNRITAGMSIAVVIPETRYKEKGWGTAYQVKFGLRANRRVIIFKPMVDDRKVQEGFEYFRKEGASVVDSVGDLLSVLKLAEEELKRRLEMLKGSDKITDFMS